VSVCGRQADPLHLLIKAAQLEVVGDSARLQQVVSNLLGNAIKFTETRGHITVTVERREGLACVIVEDTGQGIAPEFLPHLFERFRQADSAASRRHGGLGLGLAIVKNLVALHGGEVRAESDGVGRGARFSVVLPVVEGRYGLALPTLAASTTVSEPLPLDVLVVEDDADSREALGWALRETGARVRSAESVQQALAPYSARPPDVLISDVGMPGEDGYVLIRAIRERKEGRSRRTLAIAMTGFAGRQDREMALRAGFDEHVAKPAELEQLLDRVRLLETSHRRATAR
jgi:CheY-like chemotaxis protein/anti-sigma regulatory factor (Ser/Thr protein kinase)